MKSSVAIASAVFFYYILISSASPSTMSKNLRSSSNITIDHSVQLPLSFNFFLARFLLRLTYSLTKTTFLPSSSSSSSSSSYLSDSVSSSLGALNFTNGFDGICLDLRRSWISGMYLLFSTSYSTFKCFLRDSSKAKMSSARFYFLSVST